MGYSCENLENQSDDSTKPYYVDRVSQQEYIVIVKNKIDKNVLIKLRGFDKKSLIKKAMKECNKKIKMDVMFIILVCLPLVNKLSSNSW